MRKTKRQVTAVAMAAVMTVVTLAGCGGSSDSSATTAAQGGSTDTTAAPQAAGGDGQTAAGGEMQAGEASDKPYAGTKLTWWTKLNANVSATYPNLGDTPWAQYVMEQTGIEIEFIHPTVGSEKEEFSILVASGEYPDIIEHTWTS